MSDDMQVCDCNGVCKGTIVQAITTKGLFTLEDVKAHTKAAASCGSCTGLVEQILATTLGSDYSAPEAKPLCKCTDYTHDQVRDAVRDRHLTSVGAVFQAMEWRSPDGCHVCRSAINYYLLSSWPAEAADDPQSRYINERAHANIQKDGIYSVIPRIFGGPMHNWCLDLHSGQAKAPDEGCAPSFPVRVDGGRVWLSPEPAPASGQDHGC